MYTGRTHSHSSLQHLDDPEVCGISGGPHVEDDCKGVVGGQVSDEDEDVLRQGLDVVAAVGEGHLPATEGGESLVDLDEEVTFVDLHKAYYVIREVETLARCDLQQPPSIGED